MDTYVYTYIHMHTYIYIYILLANNYCDNISDNLIREKVYFGSEFLILWTYSSTLTDTRSAWWECMVEEAFLP
jgi:hypothetical protein